MNRRELMGEEAKFFKCPNETYQMSRVERRLTKLRYFDPKHGCPTPTVDGDGVVQMFDVDLEEENNGRKEKETDLRKAFI